MERGLPLHRQLRLARQGGVAQAGPQEQSVGLSIVLGCVSWTRGKTCSNGWWP
jgi:hypothetical protein